MGKLRHLFSSIQRGVRIRVSFVICYCRSHGGEVWIIFIICCHRSRDGGWGGWRSGEGQVMGNLRHLLSSIQRGWGMGKLCYLLSSI